MAGDEAAAGPDVDEEGARALWPVADTEDAAGPEADEEDASAAWLARDEASSGATCTLDLRRTTACRAMWSLRAGHTPVSRRICVHSAESPSPASWRKTRSYRAVDEPLHQVQSSTRRAKTKRRASPPSANPFPRRREDSSRQLKHRVAPVLPPRASGSYGRAGSPLRLAPPAVSPIRRAHSRWHSRSGA